MQTLLTAKLLNLPDWRTKLMDATKDAQAAGLLLVMKTVFKTATAPKQNLHLSKAEAKLVKKGKDIYNQLCISCHGKDAKGQLADKIRMAPPLAGSSRINGPKGSSINIVMHGLMGKVDGKEYPGGLMIPMGSNGDEWIAAVLSYIRLNFGNNASVISKSDVTKIRQVTKGRTSPWTLEELAKKYPTALGSKAKWKLSASHGQNKVKYAINGNLKDRFDTGAAQQPGMWLKIELPKAEKISTLVLDSASSIQDYPKGYKLESSMDGKTWKTLISKGQSRKSRTWKVAGYPPISSTSRPANNSGELSTIFPLSPASTQPSSPSNLTGQDPSGIQPFSRKISSVPFS